MIAALYVETGGVYYGLDDVDPWDEKRDARLYDGPYPVVAHPPCARWCRLAPLNEAQYGLRVGDDGGAFRIALGQVKRFGGVLEHPAHSLAWPTFGLPRPRRGSWSRTLFDPGWVTEVSQSAYGHPARKATWLYAVVPAPPEMNWDDPPVDVIVSDLGSGSSRRRGEEWVPGVQYAEASRTPIEFRDVLLDMARSANVAATH